MFSDLRPADVLAAAERIRPIVRRTRLLHSPKLGEFVHGDVWLKLENEQVTGSFKVRGAYNAMASLRPEERSRGVVASSAGNHGLGVAYAAKTLGIRATIFVPSTAPAVKREGIAALGAALDTTQPDYDAAMVAAKAFAAEHGATFINPCLGAALLAGQGTVGMEILADLPSVATVVVPVGGGGLLGGIGSIVRAVSPDVRILGVQSEHTAAMSLSVAAGRVVEIPSAATLADGLAGQIDEEALDIGLNALDEITTVDEGAIGRAITWLSRTHGLTVEGSGAVGVAALLEGVLSKVKAPVAVVVSGANIDSARHAAVLREANGN